MPDIRRACPSGLSDAEWAALGPFLPPPSAIGRPPKRPRRLMAAAILHPVRPGCAWRTPPRRFPPRPTVSSRFARRRRDGTPRRTRDRPRALAREAAGRPPEPSAATIGSRAARATGVGGPARGHGPAKRAAGREPRAPVDAAGPAPLARVHAADPHGRIGARAPVPRAAPPDLPRVGMVRGDGAYAGAAARWLAAERGRRVEAPRRRDRQLRRHGSAGKPKGFRVIPRGRVVERTFVWLARSRRLARGYERPPETGGAMTHAAVGRTMLRRVAA